METGAVGLGSPSRRIKHELTTHGSMKSVTEINGSNFIIF